MRAALPNRLTDPSGTASLLIAALVLGGEAEARRLALELARDAFRSAALQPLRRRAGESRSPLAILDQLPRLSSRTGEALRLRWRDLGDGEGLVDVESTASVDLAGVLLAEAAVCAALELAGVPAVVEVAAAAWGRPARLRVRWLPG